MKFRIIVIAQIVALLGAIIAGNVLDGDLVDGPRGLHRTAGTLAGAIGILAVVASYIHKLDLKVKIISAITVFFTFMAAASGTALSDAGDEYDEKFMYMRAFGIAALLLAAASLWLVRDVKGDKKADSKKED